ncbi:MAG: flagellar type III secretion system pore protein FliP [Candidatus Eremiobacteraeota bacterium]|nr:flagellar type III secretion system pore protein FliP [Candidatus Eremiobacteraeota bacterium]
MAGNRTTRSRLLLGISLCLMAGFLMVKAQEAQGAPMPEIKLPDITIGSAKTTDPDSMILPFQMLLLMTLLSLAPYILVMTTSFIRVTMVLSFLRTAMGTQQVPPTQVLMGLALFITFYIMAPVGQEINEKAVKPFSKKEISWNEFIDKASTPLKKFMLRNCRDKDLVLFVKMARIKKLKNKEATPLWVLIPAFVLSEIKTSFEIGFLIYLPFLVVDMVVSCILMAMGMFMLSPMSISMPFKLLLFVLIDGWDLVVEGLLRSFK